MGWRQVTDKEPKFLYTLAVWGGNLAGGFAVGWALNAMLAPGSDWGWAVGAFALPLVFGIGMQMWAAAAAGAVMKRVGGALFSALWRRTDFRDAARAELEELRGKPIPGTGAFLTVGLSGGALAGLLTAFVATAAGPLTVLAAWTGTGLGYGMLLRWLARTGRLPFPEGD